MIASRYILWYYLCIIPSPETKPEPEVIPMNVYDFDDTILRGDSTALFIRYCFTRYPKVWLNLPGLAVNALLFVLKIRPKQEFKQRMFSMFARVDDMDAAVRDFWQKHFDRVKPFYSRTRRPDDVVISASPEFLVRPACERLGINCVMASPVDMYTGIYHGLNCHGAEKVRRYRERFGDTPINDFYSDSHSDDPLASIAARAFLVRGDELLPWNS